MTDTAQDGWPEEYSDPRDRPHPDALRVTVEGFDEARAETLETADAAEDGTAAAAVVSFETVEKLRKILTTRRIELLEALVSAEGAAQSIAALADDLDRAYRSVHDDVTLLADYGIVFLVEDGQSKRPYLPYERIFLDVELTGDLSSEDSVPA